ncbi:MAG: type II toxin-antitoxin system RelE/ParE family toxin [Chloroflexota bacterium]|nr:type II toxin-antitoxin system RelE/ParE family toxin [Chloroflexota bacterium]
MSAVVVTPAAREDLERLIRTHTLPADTRDRVRRTLAPLARFLLLGALLAGQWEGLRFILGPWRWMIVVYEYDEHADRVAILTIQDGRASRAATGDKRWLRR